MKPGLDYIRAYFPERGEKLVGGGGYNCQIKSAFVCCVQCRNTWWILPLLCELIVLLQCDTLFTMWGVASNRLHICYSGFEFQS